MCFIKLVGVMRYKYVNINDNYLVYVFIKKVLIVCFKDNIDFYMIEIIIYM